MSEYAYGWRDTCALLLSYIQSTGVFWQYKGHVKLCHLNIIFLHPHFPKHENNGHEIVAHWILSLTLYKELASYEHRAMEYNNFWHAILQLFYVRKLICKQNAIYLQNKYFNIYLFCTFAHVVCAKFYQIRKQTTTCQAALLPLKLLCICLQWHMDPNLTTHCTLTDVTLWLLNENLWYVGNMTTDLQ